MISGSIAMPLPCRMPSSQNETFTPFMVSPLMPSAPANVPDASRRGAGAGGQGVTGAAKATAPSRQKRRQKGNAPVSITASTRSTYSGRPVFRVPWSHGKQAHLERKRRCSLANREKNTHYGSTSGRESINTYITSIPRSLKAATISWAPAIPPYSPRLQSKAPTAGW